MTEFSVKQATLFRSGVGWFSAEGEVDGDTIYFPVASVSLDDFLKTSLISLKGDKGSIKNLSFETKGISKNLFSSSNTLFGLLNFLRGSDVILKTGTEEIKGKLLGYQELYKDNSKIMVSMLDKEHRIIQVDADKIIEYHPVSEKDKNQLFEFLNSISAEADDSQQTTLKIQLTVTGDFTVKVSFLSDIPAWKLSYRLIMLNDNKFTLETYGIVDNNTLVDWIDARLILSTKTPTSFRYDLSTPHNISRQLISRENKPDFTIVKAKPTMNRMMSQTYDEKPQMYAEQAFDDDGFSGNIGGRDELDFEEQATMEIGEAIEYVLKNPVTIKQKQSSMVPLSQSNFTGETKLYYNENNHKNHPFFVTEFTNTLNHALDPGPITVYELDNFKGEAMLPRLGPEQDILLPYALERNVSLVTETSHKSFLQKIEIKSLKKIDIYSKLTVIKVKVSNKSEHKINLYYSIHKSRNKPVDGTFRKYKQILQYTETIDEYRFKIDVEEKSEREFEFYLVRSDQVEQYLYYLSNADLSKLLDNTELTDEEKKIIQEIYTIAIELDKLKKDKDVLEAKNVRISKRREQILNTLQVLDKETEDDVRKNYVNEIKDTDKNIRDLIEQIEKIEKKIDQLRTEQTDYSTIARRTKQSKNKNITKKSVKARKRTKK